MVAFDVRLEPSEWLGGWKPDAKRLVLKLATAPRFKDKVMVRVQLAKPSVRATLIGTVVSLNHQDALHAVELALEPESLDAAKLLLSAAKGEPVTYKERAPRFMVKLPVLTPNSEGSSYLTTVSVSVSGCSLRWPGAMPSVGQLLDLRFLGSRPLDMRGVVRWRKGASQTVGIAFVERAAAAEAWKARLEEVKKSGAPAT